VQEGTGIVSPLGGKKEKTRITEWSRPRKESTDSWKADSHLRILEKKGEARRTPKTEQFIFSQGRKKENMSFSGTEKKGRQTPRAEKDEWEEEQTE